MQREIGSNFWIAPKDLETEAAVITPAELGCGGSDFAWLSTGRSAISFVLEEAGRRNATLGKTALIPPYTCHTVVRPFLDAGYRVLTYPVDKGLRTEDAALLKAAADSGASVVLIHRYFGFDTLPDCVRAVEALRERDIITIEDRTQCLYSGFAPLPADYIVSSIRKWAGMPDGGFAVCRRGFFPEKPVEPHRTLETAKTDAGLAKYRCLFENVGDKPSFLKAFQEAEEMLNRQERYYAAAGLSMRMQAALDRESLRRKRRENYQVLLDELRDCPGVRPLFPELTEDTAPLYFPLWVEGDRSMLQSWLRDAGIYAPVVWPRPEELGPVCPEAEDCYGHLLCLPIDQRYDRDDMERTAERVCMGMGKAALPPDIYYLPEWRELYAQRDGESSGCFTFHHPDGTVLYPYVMRRTPDAGDGKTWYDIITPYGFNGPCVVDRKAEDLSALRMAFDEAFSAHCRDRQIVAEYVRFSPWLKNVKTFGSLYALRDNGQTVAIDLTAEDILRDECSSKRRNLIRTAQKKGVVVEFGQTEAAVEDFYMLYQQTIEKNRIGLYYQFSLEFLKEHFAALGSHVCVARAKVEGQTVSCSILLRCGEHMHYHLSANDYAMTAYQGNSLLLYEAAMLGKAFGCKYLHLGGVGVAEVSLMHFKLSFTKQKGLPFQVGTRVRNQGVFDRLAARYGGTGTGFFPPYRGGVGI